MAAFSSRSRGYKAGVILLFFATVIFLLGFAAPYWSNVELIPGVWTYHIGLWLVCHEVSSMQSFYRRDSGCASLGLSVSWEEHYVRVLTCVCLIILAIACTYALVTNCCRTIPGPRSVVIEVLAIFGGFPGFVGAMMYVGLKDRLRTDVDSTFVLTRRWEISWALYLTAIGSAASVVAGFIIAVNNRPAEGPPYFGAMEMTTLAAQPGYDHQPQPQPDSYGVQAKTYPEAKAGYPAPC